MTATPETDERAVWTEDTHRQSGIGLEVVPADFARRIERQNTFLICTLHFIAGTDYRGNRSQESAKAFRALQTVKEIK